MENSVAPPFGEQPAIAVSLERRLLEYLRKTEADLNTRSSLKNAKEELSSLIDEWNRDHPSRAIQDKTRFSELVFRNLVGFGPIESLLEDDAVWEISINGPKEIFVKRHDDSPQRSLETFHDERHLERVLSRMLETSVGSNRQLDSSLGIQDARLPDETRLHIVHPELTNNYSFAVSIRKFAKNSLNDIADLVDIGTLSPQVGHFLFRCAQQGATVLISGAPGTGKTTFLNALIAAVSNDKRIVVIEETLEVKVSTSDKVQLHTRANRPGRDDVSLRALVKASLRMSPDLLVLGEVRDTESLSLLLTLSTGIQGMSTIHASSCKDALSRLRLLAQLSVDIDVPIWAINQVIANSVDFVIQLSRSKEGIVVKEVISVEEGSKELEFGFVTTNIFMHDPNVECLIFTGHDPLRMKEIKVNKTLSPYLSVPDREGPTMAEFRP